VWLVAAVAAASPGACRFRWKMVALIAVSKKERKRSG